MTPGVNLHRRIQLRRGLVAYWKLTEDTTDDRIDATGRGNDLADTNAPTAVEGKIGDCNQFINASGQALSKASNTDLKVNGTSFTIAAWVWLDSKGADRHFVTKDTGSNPNREFALFFRNSSDKMVFEVYDGAGAVNGASHLGASAATGTWHFVVGWFNAAANTAHIQLNNGTISTDSTALPANASSTATFQIGFRTGAGVTTYMDGKIDAVGIWKRVLTADERAYLYNNGNGREYPF